MKPVARSVGPLPLLDSLASGPGGEHLRSCLQCGTCSASCPVAPLLEHTPRRLVALLRAGMDEEVLRSATPWSCASCYACAVRCPAGIAVTDLMNALKRAALRRGIRPRDSDAHRFARLFTDAVCAGGRATELPVMMRYMALHHPARLVGQSLVGLSMLLSGRMPLLAHRVKDLDSFHRMVARACEIEEARP